MSTEVTSHRLIIYWLTNQKSSYLSAVTCFLEDLQIASSSITQMLTLNLSDSLSVRACCELYDMEIQRPNMTIANAR